MFARPLTKLLLLCLVCLGARQAAAQPQQVSESPVTFSVVLNLTGEEKTGPAPDEPTSTLETTKIERTRFTHAHLINALRKRGTIPQTGRWQLVAIWADWPDEDPVAGLGPRLYVREQKSRSPRIIRIPEKVASLTLTEPARQQAPIFDKSGRLTGGREDYIGIANLTVRFDDLSASVSGLDTGRMTYRKPSSSHKTATILIGRTEAERLEGIGRLVKAKRKGVATGSLNLAAGRFVPLSLYVPEPVAGHDYSGSNQFQGSLTVVGGGGLGFFSFPQSYPVVVCPVDMRLGLWTETTRRQTIAGGKRRYITTRTRQDFDETDLLLAALAKHEITDPAGWSLVAAARENNFGSFANFDLMALHEDGTLLALAKSGSLFDTVVLGESKYSPRLVAGSDRAVASKRVITADGALTEQRRSLILGSYHQLLPFDDIKLNLAGLYDSRDVVTEEDILADPPENIVTHASTKAVLIGSHDKGGAKGPARLVLEIGAAEAEEYIYHEPSVWGPVLSIDGSGLVLGGLGETVNGQ